MSDTRISRVSQSSQSGDDFVLEKSIFSNIFEKDIRRVYIYKKAERLAKAIHLITPAFASSMALRNRLDAIAIALVDAAIQPPVSAKESLSRELLALSSVLGIARSGGLLSVMNTTLITNEAHSLLAEIAVYEEPRLFLEDSPTLAGLAKGIRNESEKKDAKTPSPKARTEAPTSTGGKGHIKDSKRTEAIISVIKDKGTVYIKDISTVIRDVSEKTIQRELRRLVLTGVVVREGERRWAAYSLSP